ncbi:class I SAM-dependent methyltransferase [Saccharomonospora viridis]|jgi:SAM-dependent methyltransferase|uniref:Methylase involved in ubiquinone/menaquinone biosynthesis n=2 Tax=Saccharomonospora viridis TaxID=1852 RepID=C7MWG4_SACVD|nr:methyltransferase [Saccharomonospora viridis]ACU95823.1 methylase involved in ubiquinone/menaquinone biosynthesis [Saccharomonospora viridis DSM 43017]KHF45691.1 methylase [Saccharomonospora viridis]SFP71461.1 Methyltransferase domain-containing protein [Saccharomonospora viridis]
MATTHDDIDWAARLEMMRRSDALESDALRRVAVRLASGLGPDGVVVDAGCGSGGMSAALASVLRDNGGGRLILIDATEELLRAAQEVASSAGGETVTVTPVVADLGAVSSVSQLPPADLVWASGVVHHLPDQQAGVTTLASLLAPGGTLALAEGGLGQRSLPWDLGVGRPGLEERLYAARNVWFHELRSAMDGVVDMPYGWTTALARAGLEEPTSFSYLVDHPAPAPEVVREHVVEHLARTAEVLADYLAPDDRDTLTVLLDPENSHYLGARDDVFLLSVRSVHTGRRPR